jgi:hypothetical protein
MTAVSRLRKLKAAKPASEPGTAAASEVEIGATDPMIDATDGHQVAGNGADEPEPVNWSERATELRQRSVGLQELLARNKHELGELASTAADDAPEAQARLVELHGRRMALQQLAAEVGPALEHAEEMFRLASREHRHSDRLVRRQRAMELEGDRVKLAASIDAMVGVLAELVDGHLEIGKSQVAMLRNSGARLPMGLDGGDADVRALCTAIMAISPRLTLLLTSGHLTDPRVVDSLAPRVSLYAYEMRRQAQLQHLVAEPDRQAEREIEEGMAA